MAVVGRTQNSADQRARMERLVRERVGEPYGLFFVNGEGKPLPDGSEMASGYVVDAQARVHLFVVGWDDRAGAAVITRWLAVRPQHTWYRSEEYQEARRAAGFVDDPTPGDDVARRGLEPSAL